MADAPARKKSLISTLVEGLIPTLLAGGVGFGLAMINPPPDSAEKPKDKVEVAAADCGAGGPSLADMPPIVTNIATPSDTWVRLEAAIVFDPKSLIHPEVVAAEIATDELAYLRTVSVTDLQGPIGLENIRQDLRDRALVRSGGKVTDLLLRTLVLQ